LAAETGETEVTMRRAATAKVLLTGALLAAVLCACGTAAANAPAPAGTAISPAADASSATVSVCQQIRSDLASRMDSLGEAMGDYLGYQAADDDKDVVAARRAVTAQVNALGSDISRAGRAATDETLRAAAEKASTAVDRVVASSDFFDDIDSLSDIPAAIDKISDAAQPVADACS
jgi:ABC-type phosphate transport system substrate-binding protein